MLYQAYQAQSDGWWPVRMMARLAAPMWLDSRLGAIGGVAARRIAAACQVLELAEVRHQRPPWRIDSVRANGQAVRVVEEAVLSTPFATLLRFAKPGVAVQPKVLVVAPMSGHFATLLRDTVRTVLQDHEVYVTDWHNVRDVPLAAGRFGLDEYTQQLIDFLAAMGPNANVIAVCQPCVAALAAVALIPGFVQLSAFMSMNKARHADAFKAYYQHLVAGEFEQAEITRTFYDEYLAVADLSADFYLETVQKVFQDHALPRGELLFRGRKVNPAAIRRTALLTVEGERDDICAIGQTLAAQDLASSLRLYLRTHYVQPNVGHYGLFSGKRWQNQIYPVVRDVIHTSQ